MKIVWSPLAARDLDRIQAFLEARDPQAAERVTAELLAAGDCLDLLPKRGRPGQVSGTRELPVVPPY